MEQTQHEEKTTSRLHFITHEPSFLNKLLQVYWVNPKSWLLKEFKYEDGILYISVMNGNELTAPIEECSFRYQKDKYDRMEIYVKSGEKKLHFKEIPGMLKDEDWETIMNFLQSHEESSIDADKTKQKKKLPWKNILKCMGIIAVAALLFLAKNARYVGKVARIASHEIQQDEENTDAPKVVGKWKIEGTSEDTDYGDDDIITKCTVKENDIYEFKEDGTVIWNGSFILIFDVEDYDYSNVITLSYNTFYRGTWEQEGLNLNQTGEKFNMVFVNSATRYNRSDDSYYIQMLQESIEENLPTLILRQSEEKIKILTRDQMITEDEDGNEIIYTRID